MKWTFPDNLIAGFIRYDLCKTCKTDNNHQRDSCINCRNKREAPEISRDFCRTMMTIVNDLLGLSKAYKFPFGAVRNAFYWHFCQRQKAEITHAFNLITHRPYFFLNKPNLIGIVGQFGTGQFTTDSSEYTQGALPLGPPLKASGRMKRVWGEVNFMNLGWGSQPHRSTSLSKAPRCLCQSSKNISHTQVKLPAFVRAVGLTSSP